MHDEDINAKIINTAMMGEIKLEIIFTSQIASCILGSAVPVDTPVYAQAANTFEIQNNLATTTIADTDIDANATNAATKLQTRVNIQKFTANFTTGGTGIATAGNANAAYNAQQTAANIDPEVQVFFYQ